MMIVLAVEARMMIGLADSKRVEVIEQEDEFDFVVHLVDFLNLLAGVALWVVV